MLQNPAENPAIARWCKQLDDHPLPVMPASANALREALKQSDVALHDLGSIMAADPVMSLHLLRECQRQFGKRVEGQFGFPQDIEWALGDDGKIYILQSRPVTV